MIISKSQIFIGSRVNAILELMSDKGNHIEAYPLSHLFHDFLWRAYFMIPETSISCIHKMFYDL